MHANNDSLGVRSAYRFREQMRREGLMEYAGLPDRLSSFGRIVIVGPIPRKCPEVVVIAVDKIAHRCKQATAQVKVSVMHQYMRVPKGQECVLGTVRTAG